MQIEQFDFEYFNMLNKTLHFKRKKIFSTMRHDMNSTQTDSFVPFD